MRTARFFPDGSISSTVSIKNPDDRVSISFQALPWLETTFRWANDYAIRQAAGAGQGADRSFDVKIRLWDETRYWPAFAVGFQDIAGTGIYAAQFAVASKSYSDFDFTLGIGWNRLATRTAFSNPLRLISSSFGEAPDANFGLGGTFNLRSYFRGPDVGLFGGVEYRTPIRNLKLQLEFSSDAYSLEKRESGIDYGFPINFGVSYKPFEWLDVGLSFMHGREIGFRVSAFLDPTKEPWSARIEPRTPPLQARGPEIVAAPEIQDQSSTAGSAANPGRINFIDLTKEIPGHHPGAKASAASASPTLGSAAQETSKYDAALHSTIEAALTEQRISVAGLTVQGDTLKIVIRNALYRRDAEAVARTARVLTALAPGWINYFEITTAIGILPGTIITLPRITLDAMARANATPTELWYAATLAPGPVSLPDYAQPKDWSPDFSYNFYPTFRQMLFDPDNPFRFAAGLGVGLGIGLARGLAATAHLNARLYDTFGSFDRDANSVLPHVRTDVREYIRGGRYTIDDLTLDYGFKLTPEVYGVVRGGYLEQMFAGVGGEVLYRPFGKRWAVGLDAWNVRQRGYDGLFSLRNYETFTWHASVYYEAPWHNLLLVARAGRYLAGDLGATFEVSRQFAGGITVGGWFTLTNVPFRDFGEGSFDKGIRITIPLEWAAPLRRKSSYLLELRPILRDGGAIVARSKELYDVTSPLSYGALSEQWSSVFKP